MEGWPVAAAVLLAVLARALHAAARPAMFNDGPRFLAIARAFSQGDWRTAIADPFHPLMGAFMAALGALLPLDLETAAHGISIAAGGLATAAIYALARASCERSVALGAALVVALHPRLIASSDGLQSDGLYLACALGGAAAAWSALRSGRLAAALGSGVLCGLAYLARPEGLAVAAVFGVACIGAYSAGLRRPLELLRPAVGLALALSLTAAPYVLAVHAQTGTWSITQKKDVSSLVGITALKRWLAESPRGAAPADGPPAALRGAVPGSAAPPVNSGPPTAPPPAAEPPAGGALLAALRAVIVNGYKAWTPVGVALLMLGLRRGRPQPLTLYLLAYAALFASLLLALQLSAGYVSRRHWLLVVALAAPVTARGALAVWNGVARRWPALQRSRSAALGAVALAALGSIVWTAALDVSAAKAARREAACWLGETHHPLAVATHRARDAHYAGASRFVSIHGAESAAGVRERATAGAVRYAVVDLGELPASAPAELRELGHELHRVEYEGGAVVVLDLGEQPQASMPGTDMQPVSAVTSAH